MKPVQKKVGSVCLVCRAAGTLPKFASLPVQTIVPGFDRRRRRSRLCDKSNGETSKTALCDAAAKCLFDSGAFAIWFPPASIQR